MQFLLRPRALPARRPRICISLPTKPFNRSQARTFAFMNSPNNSPSKKQKLTGPLIGTHSGQFHADEALAVYLLRLLPTYTSSPLLRTRDPALLSTCHTVVDVGGAYDPSAFRFDHHQRGFDAVFPGFGTKLSSAGLVYLHFGKQIIAQSTGLDEGGEEAECLWRKCYEDLIEAFDANDNGIDVYDQAELQKAGIAKRFENRGFSIASVVNRLNYHHPLTPEAAAAEKSRSAQQKQEDEDARFEEASRFVGGQFEAELLDKWKAWLPARALVREAYASRKQWHDSGAVMVLKQGAPWSDHLYELEAAHAEEAKVLFVLFPEDESKPDTKWRIKAVSVEGGGFKNRKDLPNAWKGLRDEELDKVSGIPGCVFVHMAGFIGGNKTFQGALEMAKKAVEL